MGLGFVQRAFSGSGFSTESLWWVWVLYREHLVGLGSLQGAFGGSGFSTEGNLIFTSAAPRGM